MKNMQTSNYKNLLFFIFIIPILFINPKLNANDDANTLIIPADTWAPFRMIENDTYTGIDFDLIKEVEKRLGKKIKIVKSPWARNLINMKNGKVDVMTGVAKREERAKYLHYIQPPYFTCSTVFYVKKGNAHKIKKYDDLKDYLIGQVDNSAYFDPYDSDKSIFKRSVKNEIQLLRMLLVDRLQVIIGTDCQIDFDIAKMGYKDKFEKTEYKPNNNVNLYFTLSKKSKHAKDLDKISTIIKDIIKEQKVKEFAKKYYQ